MSIINYVTNFGKIIDPVADKVCLMAVLIYLMGVYKMPFFIFFILLSIRDIVLISFSLYFLLYTNYVPQANKFGKIFIFSTSLMIIFYIYSINDIVSVILYFISLFLLIISMFKYIKSHLKINYEKTLQIYPSPPQLADRIDMSINIEYIHDLIF